MPYSVLIVEDDPQFRTAFALAIQGAENLRLVGEAGDLPDGFLLLEKNQPDVLLVDIGLPSGSGIELIRYAHAHLPQCDVMVITVFGDEQRVLACIEAGATGYLLKGGKAIDIVEQIYTLREGGSPISPAIARQLMKRLLPKPCAPQDGHGLSEQEQKVLELSNKGYSYEEIAQLLQLSRNTVATYVKRIYGKLQAHSKSEAIYEARRLGLLRE